MSADNIVKITPKDKKFLILAAASALLPTIAALMYLTVCWFFDRHPKAPLSNPYDVNSIYIASAVCGAPTLKFSPTDEILHHRKVASIKACEIELRRLQDRLAGDIPDEERIFIGKTSAMIRASLARLSGH